MASQKAIATEIRNQLRGRLLTARELAISAREIEVLKMINDVMSIAAIQLKGKNWYCQRCHNYSAALFQENFCNCQHNCVYCLQCLPFGKIRSCDQLFHLPEIEKHEWGRSVPYCKWLGELSVQQEQAAVELCQSLFAHQTRLVWAVTGAGKTEMIFPAIDQALVAGKRVVIATPRIDVANELLPRLQAAFPEINILLLHSDSQESYRHTAITICSTHQLIRFQAAFDLTVIDEIDAFPFQGSEMLHFAAKRAAKSQSSTILLTATPSPAMQDQIKRGQIEASILPARYHRHPLPVPKHIWVGDWRTRIRQGKIPWMLLVTMRQFIHSKRSFLLFLPNISLMLQCEKLLKQYFPDQQFTSVSSRDEERVIKVQQMRDLKWDFILTTTILERGVTFSAIDVIILGSEDKTFTLAALIQISGRVGRTANAPDGKVIFLHYGKTRASKAAVRQIRLMNNTALKRGLIDV